MSRVGKNPVAVPQGVEVSVVGNQVTAKGKLGSVSLNFSDLVGVTKEATALKVAPKNDSKEARALWGATRANLKNLVDGVAKGYTKDLEINGVGFRAAVTGKVLTLQLGFSHDVVFPIPDGISIKCEKPTSIAVSGFDRQKVGQVASEIRALRPPEPYKGKGIKYADEQILRKEGKKK